MKTKILNLFALTAVFSLLGCGTEVNPVVDPSSSSDADYSSESPSSSSSFTEVVVSSSSEVASSSSLVPSSSSVVVSSSVVPSSSSIAESSSIAPSSSVAVSSSSSLPIPGTPGADLVYGGQTYKTVIMGTQTWMAENLNFSTATGSWCYGELATNCTTYGRLYNYATALTVCPSGWHLPDTTAWHTLEATVGGSATAGTKLKANSALWRTNTGTDNFGFSALPGGYYTYLGSNFYNIGGFGYWWTATPRGSFIYYRFMEFDGAYVADLYDMSQATGLSVRCLKD